MLGLKKILNNNKAVVSPLESLTAFSIVFIMIAFLFVGANGFFQSYPMGEADVYIKNIHVAERLISDTGMATSGSPFWEENTEELEVLGLAAPNTVEGFTVFDNDTGEFIYSMYAPWQGTWSTTGGLVLVGSYTGNVSCFLAGTKVLMADGSYKNIEDIEVGEKVFCFNEDNHNLVVGKVTSVMHHDTPDQLSPGYFVVNNHLYVTPNHMLLTSKGWKTVADLRIGDILANGEMVFSLKPVIKSVATYNLDVEPFDNYIVLGNTDTVVHNLEAFEIADVIEEDGFGNNLWGGPQIPAIPSTKPCPFPGWEFVVDPSRPEKGYWLGTLNLAFLEESVSSSYNFEITDIDIVEGENNNTNTIVHYRYTTNDDNQYAILDWNKIQALKKVKYSQAKEALGIPPGYDFALTITYLNGSILLEYPENDVNYDNLNIVTRYTRNVIIFKETNYDEKLISDDIGKNFLQLLPFLTGSRELASFELVVYR